jgi:hypothetical protein
MDEDRNAPRAFTPERIIIMPRAREEIRGDDIARMLERHFLGYCGDDYVVTDEERDAAEESYKAGGAFTSSFWARDPSPYPVHITTNAERTETVVASEGETEEEQT